VCKIFIKEGRVILEKIEWRDAMKDRFKTVLAVTLIACALALVFGSAITTSEASSVDGGDVTDVSSNYDCINDYTLGE